MITNLLATIVTVLSTNVVEMNNEQGCRICYDKSFHPFTAEYISPHGHDGITALPYKAATERTIVTTIEQVRTISFEFEGKPLRAILDKKLISTDTRRLVLDATWRDVKP